MGKILFLVPAFPRLNVKRPVIFKLHPSTCLACFEDDFFSFVACRDIKYSSWVMVSFLSSALNK